MRLTKAICEKNLAKQFQTPKQISNQIQNFQLQLSVTIENTKLHQEKKYVSKYKELLKKINKNNITI